MQGTGSRQQFSIVAHSHLRWDFVWQRPQHVFSRLAKDHRVLFVEEALHEPGTAHLRIVEAQPNVLRAIPVLPEPGSTDAHCEAVLPLLRTAMAGHPLLAGRFDAPVQWFYSPMCAPEMLGKLGELAVVYDCMDELANFRFAPPDIRERELLLLRHADVVFTGGRGLYESKSRHNSNVHFFGCGVDVEHFSQARKAQTAVPASVAGLPGPVLGYFGVIDERLDYKLIAALADANRGGAIVMAGPLAKVAKGDLPQRPNIHWLGQQSYAALPALVKAFDVCLMPFALNEATRYINPTKTLEYMAAGKPVVSTPVPDVVRNFGDVVHIGASPEAFIEAALRAAAVPDPQRIAAGIARADGATWDATVAAMRGHLLEAVRGRTALAAA
jgi:glycosyltransferase involved in cell wall biosynthesis